MSTYYFIKEDLDGLDEWIEEGIEALEHRLYVEAMLDEMTEGAE